MENRSLSFGELFKKFRLRSGIPSLSGFGKILADEGLIYEDSMFSRWQNNQRVPRNRNILLKIVKVFIQKGGISNLKDISLFLESAGQGFVTETEKNFLLPIFRIQDNFSRKEQNYTLILESTLSTSTKIDFLQSQINFLNELIYQGNPLTAYKRLRKIEKILLTSEFKNEKIRINLLSRLHWVTARCLSDICKPGKFLPGILTAEKNLSFALEKNSQGIGGLFWMNSALMRLQILTVPKERIYKPFLKKCLDLAEAALENTSKTELETKILEHIEIAKIALLIEDKNLFEKEINFGLSITPKLPHSFRYLAALVWDAKARGSIRFYKDLDSALEDIQAAKNVLDDRYQAIHLFLGNTELQALNLSNDSMIIKQANLLKNRMSLLADILNNPYQKLRVVKEKYVGL